MIKSIFGIVILSIFVINNVFCNSNNLINDLLKTGKHHTLVKVIENNPLFLSLLNNNIKSTFYVPTDQAFRAMPKTFKNDISNNNTKVTTKLILSHIFSGDSTSIDEDNQNMVLSLDGSLYYIYDHDDLFVKDIVLRGETFKSGFYTLIPTDCVMFLQPSTNDKRLDEKIRDKYKLTTCCLQSEQEFKEFYAGL